MGVAATAAETLSGRQHCYSIATRNCHMLGSPSHWK